jgi:phage-related protein
VEPRFKLCQRLNEFVLQSSPNDEQIRALDKIAAAVASDLMRLTIEERLKALVERSTELARLTKDFQAQADAAASAAGAIRLEKARKVILTLTDTVSAIKEFGNALEEGKDADLAARLDRAMKSIQDLRSLIERQA